MLPHVLARDRVPYGSDIVRVLCDGEQLHVNCLPIFSYTSICKYCCSYY